MIDLGSDGYARYSNLINIQCIHVVNHETRFHIYNYKALLNIKYYEVKVWKIFMLLIGMNLQIRIAYIKLEIDLVLPH
jgi:hypothetical protein